MIASYPDGGISIVGHATDVTWETWRKTMDVNLDGTFNMVYAVKDEVIQREFGRMVLISSIAALRDRGQESEPRVEPSAPLASGAQSL